MIRNVGKLVLLEVVEETVVVVDDAEGGLGIDLVKLLVGDVGAGISQDVIATAGGKGSGPDGRNLVVDQWSLLLGDVGNRVNVTLGAVALCGRVVNQSSGGVDLVDTGNLPTARCKSNLVLAVHREEVDVVPPRLVRQVKVVLLFVVFALALAFALCLAFSFALLLRDGADEADGRVVVEPAVGSITLAGEGGGLGGGVNNDELFVVLNTVESAVDDLVVLLGQPSNLANDQVISCPRSNRNLGCLLVLDAQEVEGHGGVGGADLGIPQLQLTGIGRGDLLVVHKVRNREGVDSGLVEAQVSNVLAVGRIPERMVGAKDFLLVDPVGNSVEKIRAAVGGDLADGAIVPEEEVVALDKGNLGGRRRVPGSILDITLGTRHELLSLPGGHILDQVVGKVGVTILLSIVDSPQDLGLVVGDGVVPIVGGDLAGGEECGLVAAGDVFKDKRSVGGEGDEVAVVVGLGPGDSGGGHRESAGAARGDIVREQLGAASDGLVGGARWVDG